MKESELRNMLQEKGLPDSWWLTVDGKVESSPVSLGTAMTLKKAQSRSQIFVAHTSDNNPQPNWIELELTRETMPPMGKTALPPALSEPMAQMDKGKIDRYRSSLNLPDQWWISVNGEVQKDPVTEEIAKLLKSSNPTGKVLVANLQGDSSNPFWIDFLLSDSSTAAAPGVLTANGPVRTTVRPSESKAAPAVEPTPVPKDKKPLFIGIGVAAVLVIGLIVFLATKGGNGSDTVDNKGGTTAGGDKKNLPVPLVTPEMAYAPNAAMVVRLQLAKIRLQPGGPALATALAERFLAGPLFSNGPLAVENISEVALSGQGLGQSWTDGPSSFCVALVPSKPMTAAELGDLAKKAGSSGSWTKLESGPSTVPFSGAHIFPLPSGQSLVMGYAAEPVTQVFLGTADAVRDALGRCVANKAASPTFSSGPLPAEALVYQAGLLPDGVRGSKAPEYVASFLGVIPQSTAAFSHVESYAVELSSDGKKLRLLLGTTGDDKARTLEKAVNEELVGPCKSLARRTYLKIPGFIGEISAATEGVRVAVSAGVTPEDSAILVSMATRGTPAPTTKNTPAVASGNTSKPTPTPTLSTPAKTFISLGSSWKYFSGESWPSNWNAATFDDASWSSGMAPIGYGEVGAKDNPVTTTVQGKPLSLIARHKFTVADPSTLKRITIRLQRDDAAVLYLNGREIHRSGMPSGRITYDTLASRQISDKNEMDFEIVALPVSLLKVGDNVIALSVHQDRTASSDLFFNLELLAE